MSEDDQRLVDSFSEHRDDRSFRQLYRRHSPMLYALAVRLSRSRKAAENLLQETWFRAVSRHENFQHRSKYSTWLVGILINCHREDTRRISKSERVEQEYKEETGHSATAALFDGPTTTVNSIDVERALSSLAPGYREIVILHDVNGYTHKEIAAMLGIEEGTSKSQLHRGRSKLRVLLSDNESKHVGNGDAQEQS